MTVTGVLPFTEYYYDDYINYVYCVYNTLMFLTVRATEADFVTTRGIPWAIPAVWRGGHGVLSHPQAASEASRGHARRIHRHHERMILVYT